MFRIRSGKISPLVQFQCHCEAHKNRGRIENRHEKYLVKSVTRTAAAHGFTIGYEI